MNIAAIGTGMIVERFFSAAAFVEGANPYGVYSRSEENGRRIAERFHFDHVYTDLKQMLEDPNIDCVYIASPNSLHYPHARQALQASKHVICEKPFTSTARECAALYELAKQKQLFLFEAIVTIHMPNYRLLKSHLPELGTIRMVQCNFSQYSSRYDQFLAGATPNVFHPAYSGGALADINIYNLHFVMNLFGRPNHAVYYPNMQRGIDTSGVLLMSYDGFQAVCVGCKDTRSHNIAQIQGENGYITLNSETSRCANFSVTTKNGTILPSVKQHEISLYYELKEFIRIMQEQDTDTFHELMEYSLSVMEVYEAARVAAGIHFPADDA